MSVRNHIITLIIYYTSAMVNLV